MLLSNNRLPPYIFKSRRKNDGMSISRDTQTTNITSMNTWLTRIRNIRVSILHFFHFFWIPKWQKTLVFNETNGPTTVLSRTSECWWVSCYSVRFLCCVYPDFVVCFSFDHVVFCLFFFISQILLCLGIFQIIINTKIIYKEITSVSLI